MKVQRLSRVLIAVILIVIVAACGNSNGKTGEQKLVLEYWTNSGPESEKIAEIMTQYSEDHPDTQVNMTIVPGSPTDYYQKLSAAFASGKGPDIFAMSPGEFMKYAESGLAYPINEWIDPNKDDYFENTLLGNTIDG